MSQVTLTEKHRRILDLSKVLGKVLDLETKIDQNESYWKKEELIKATESLEILSGSYNPTIGPISQGICVLNRELKNPREYMKLVREIIDLIVELREGCLAYSCGETSIKQN